MATAKQRAARRPVKKTTKKAAKERVLSTKSQTAASAQPAIVAGDAAAAAAAPARIPGAWQIMEKSLSTLQSQWRLFLGLTLIYVVLNMLLARTGSSALDINGLKSTLGGNFTGGFSQLWTSLSLFTVLVATSTNTSSNAAAAYETILGIIVSLAIVWALRQVIAGHARVRIRDSFYKGMYPLIPAVLVLAVVMLELIPFVIGGYIYGMVVSNGIAVHLFEKILWALVLLLGFGITAYLLSSSIFSLYISTLPDMTPVKALRSGRDLVRGRRWPVLRKLLFLPLALFVVGAIIMSPILLYATGFAQWMFFLLSMLGLVFVHAYLYTLYRELIG